MRTLVFALAGILSVAGSAQAQDGDNVVERIIERIDKELRKSEERLKADIRRLIREEIEKAGGAKQEAPRETQEAKLKFVLSVVERIKEDGGINSRIRKFCSTAEGRKILKEMLEQADMDEIEEGLNQYFDEDKDGRLTVKEEYEEEFEEFLQLYGPQKEGKPGEVPGAAPKGKPYMGFSVDTFNDDDRKKHGVPAGLGIRVFGVRDDTPAAEAGLWAGDIVLAIDGKDLNEDNIEEILADYAPGDTVTLTVQRMRKKMKLELVLGVRPEK